jgi:hypothetical protein
MLQGYMQHFALNWSSVYSVTRLSSEKMGVFLWGDFSMS